MKQCIGINFGTTNTAVVCVLGKKTTHLGENGEYPFSSVVAIPKNEDGAILFGREVRDRKFELSATHDVYTSMKSHLGTDKRFAGNRYSAKEIVSAFFRHIKKYIEQQHGIDISEAALSYPVDFPPEARRELCAAAEKAGIKVTVLVNESTAAYIANHEICRPFSKVMVLDWGGGTFDTSILKLTGTSIHEIAVWGDYVGGDDVDRELAERIHSRIVAQSEINIGRFEDAPPTVRDQMHTRCEFAKISISNGDDDYSLRIRNCSVYGDRNISITAEYLDSVVAPIIKSRIFTAIDKALGKAELSPDSIDAVIIVGGSSNLSSYERAISNLFKNAKIIYDSKKAQWATATGAALMQVIGGKLRLSEEICVLMSEGTAFPILPKGHPIGVESAPVSFALTEDSLVARFIFTDATGKTTYKSQPIKAKGFLQEEFVLKAIITDDQIARVRVSNKHFGEDHAEFVEINKLNFHYDIAPLIHFSSRGSEH